MKEFGQLELSLQSHIRENVERGVDRAEDALMEHPRFGSIFREAGPDTARLFALVAIEAYVTELKLQPPPE
jgi:hypothetical protein